MKTEQVRREGLLRRAVAGRSMDITVALLSFLVFVLFMFLLGRWLFPTGTSLQTDGAAPVADDVGGSTRPELSFSGRTGPEPFLADLVSITRNVQTKGREDLAWAAAREGQSLAGQDSLQTQKKSGATVQLADGSVLRIGADSLIVFQGGNTDVFTRRRTNSIVMMSGSLDAEYAVSDEHRRHIEIALPNGLARFIPGEDDAAVAFNIHVNPDLSSSVSVLSGTGVVTVGGRTTTVDTQHGITISINGEVIEQGRLLRRPDAVVPRDSVVYRYRDLPPAIDFSWGAVPNADQYRFRLARDEQMNDIVIDERFGGQSFAYGGLQDGEYYWQVSAMTGFIEGLPAGPRRLALVRDEKPPKLELQAPEILAGRERAVVRGRTDRGSRVFVQGEPVSTEAGRFEQTVQIEPGVTLIVVEAVDRAGNVAYDSRIVNSNTSINGGGR